MDLSIDVEMNSSVTSCLRQFSASETLCHQNKYFCDECSGLQEAERRMKIKKLPSILALHLKRFKYQEQLQKYIKLTYRVVFPFELRLFNTVWLFGDVRMTLANINICFDSIVWRDRRCWSAIWAVGLCDPYRKVRIGKCSTATHTVPLFCARSGPHHGHYVTVIKSNGQWMLFDDDEVTVSISTYTHTTHSYRSHWQFF